MQNLDQILQRGDALARQSAGAGVLESQLAFVLTHLCRHQDLPATLKLLESLRRSPFSRRSRQTPAQLEALRRYVTQALAGITDWREAAWIVGWGRRLAKDYGAKS